MRTECEIDIGFMLSGKPRWSAWVAARLPKSYPYNSNRQGIIVSGVILVIDPVVRNWLRGLSLGMSSLTWWPTS